MQPVPPTREHRFATARTRAFPCRSMWRSIVSPGVSLHVSPEHVADPPFCRVQTALFRKKCSTAITRVRDPREQPRTVHRAAPDRRDHAACTSADDHASGTTESSRGTPGADCCSGVQRDVTLGSRSFMVRMAHGREMPYTARIGRFSAVHAKHVTPRSTTTTRRQACASGLVASIVADRFRGATKRLHTVVESARSCCNPTHLIPIRDTGVQPGSGVAAHPEQRAPSLQGQKE